MKTPSVRVSLFLKIQLTFANRRLQKSFLFLGNKQAAKLALARGTNGKELRSGPYRKNPKFAA